MIAFRSLLCAALLCVVAIARVSGAATTVDGRPCFADTSVEFIVDTSVSTDKVYTQTAAALQTIGDAVNGVVLSFSKYYLTTWNNYASDYKTFASIHDLYAYFIAPSAGENAKVAKQLLFFDKCGRGNKRVYNDTTLNPAPPGVPYSNNDFRYMWESLKLAITHADTSGIIVIIGDQNQLCDARSTFFPYGFDPFPINPSLYAETAAYKAQAAAKFLQIFFYYIFEPNIDIYAGPNGGECGYTGQFGRAAPMNWLSDFATTHNGFADFEYSVNGSLAHTVKVVGGQAIICNNTCTADPTFGLIVDTSASSQNNKAQYIDLFNKLSVYAANGAFVPFNRYEFASFSGNGTAYEFDTFYEMNAYVNTPHALDNTFKSDDDTSTPGNDWVYLLMAAQAMLPKMGVDGFLIIITDQEGVCDFTRYGDVMAQQWQDFLNGMKAKRVSLSFYTFAYGDDGVHPGLNDCSAALRAPGEAKMMALSNILGGKTTTNLLVNTPQGVSDAVYQISQEAVLQSLRPSCKNCTNNATLTFIMDTSISTVGNHLYLMLEYIKIGQLPASSLQAYTGGFNLNTWGMPLDVIYHFSTYADLLSLLQHPIANVVDAWAPTRASLVNPAEPHDDWGYMLESLAAAAAKAGTDGVMLIVADDNMMCDCGKFGHTAAEQEFIYEYAATKNLQVFFFHFATKDFECSAADIAAGNVLATALANGTGGAVFLGTNYANTPTDVDLMIAPIVAGGTRKICPQLCPANFVWAGTKCIEVNPCVPNPCENGATCVPDLYAKDYECECTSDWWGPVCQYPCVPASMPGNVSHALGFVIDTSASSMDVMNGMKGVVDFLGANTFNFDQYFLSTWAFTHFEDDLVQTFPNMSALEKKLDMPQTATNQRLVEDSPPIGGDHNDWRYMLDSVATMIPKMGTHGVIIVLADEEQVCDADPAARNNIFPANPLTALVNSIHDAAEAAEIKIYYITFPSYHSGLCHTGQRDIGYAQAKIMTGATGGFGMWHGYVLEPPQSIGVQSLANVADEISAALSFENSYPRCACPTGTVMDGTICKCPNGGVYDGIACVL